MAVVPTVPNVCPPQNALYNFCSVEDMTLRQTEMWVWTFCFFQGWDSCKAYAEKFRNHGITGANLRKIDMNMMENELCIENCQHREQLMGAIDLLFPIRL